MKHLQVSKRFILEIGINPSILLSELLNKERYLLDNDSLVEWEFFFHEYKFIHKNTGLLKSKFNTARKKLEELWIISTKYGEWKRLLYSISQDKLYKIFFPESIQELQEDDFMDLVLDEGYIVYPCVLAHKIGINETIFIKSLLSKRKTFLKQWKLKEWYFFNSVSNIKNDTSLSRDQQLKCIKNLVSLNLLDVKYDYDSTRYFCINIDLLLEIETLNINDIITIKENIEKEKNPKSISLSNPFIKSESWKHDTVEVWKLDAPEVLKTDTQKTESSTTRKLKNWWVEDLKPYTNNNKKENKEIILKNNNKQDLLLPFFKNIKTIDSLIEKYDIESIKKVLKQLEKKEVENPAGFITWALSNNIDFSSKQDHIKTLIKEKENIDKNKENETNIERKKLLKSKKEYLEWKENNKKQYEEIFSNIKNKLNTWNIHAITLNVNVEKETKEYIINNLIWE